MNKRLLVAVACLVMLVACKKASSITATLSPSNGSSDIAQTTSVSAAFSDSISVPSTWTEVFMLTAVGSTENLCTSVSYSTSTGIATCKHDTLDMNTEYTITLQGVQDGNGASIADESSVFTTTETEGDSSVSLSSSVESLESDVALNAPVSVSFSDDITVPSDWSDILLLTAGDSATNLCTAVSYSSSSQTATCKHAELLAGTQYTITVQGLDDADSFPIESTNTFTTVGLSAKVTLSDGETEIEEGDSGVVRSNSVKAIFSSGFASLPSNWNAYLVVAKDADPDTNLCTTTYSAANKTATCKVKCGSVNKLCASTDYLVSIVDLPYGDGSTYSLGPIAFTTKN